MDTGLVTSFPFPTTVLKPPLSQFLVLLLVMISHDNSCKPLPECSFFLCCLFLQKPRNIHFSVTLLPPLSPSVANLRTKREKRIRDDWVPSVFNGDMIPSHPSKVGREKEANAEAFLELIPWSYPSLFCLDLPEETPWEILWERTKSVGPLPTLLHGWSVAAPYQGR